MKKKLSTIGILLIAIIIVFFSYRKYQQSKTTDENVINMAVDRIMEREENDRMLQFVREYLNDSTIQIVDYEKSIFIGNVGCRNSVWCGGSKPQYQFRADQSVEADCEKSEEGEKADFRRLLHFLVRPV